MKLGLVKISEKRLQLFYSGVLSSVYEISARILSTCV